MARSHNEGSRSVPLPPRTAESRQSSNISASRRAPRATVGAATIANVNKSADNQDTYGCSSGGSSKNFVGVFDGHGEMGHKISQFACDALQRNLFTNSNIKNDPRSAMRAAYKDTQAQIIHEHGEDAMFSGTTAVSAYLNKDHLAIANVGDSRAVIGRCGTACSRASQASLCAIDLSSDHKPDRKDERYRIEQRGGKVGQSLFPVENIFGAVNYVRAGPARVMGPDGMGGLAMSRSLGDAYLHPHVIAEPEIYERKLDSRDKLLILGSDGIWDMMGSQEAVNIARSHKDPNVAARKIADISKQRWMAETNNMMTDDITAVVMRLDHKEKERDPQLNKYLASSIGQRSDRPISGSRNSDRMSGHRSSNSRLEKRGGYSTGQRSDNPISASKNSDRSLGASTGQRSDRPNSGSKSFDRTSGQRKSRRDFTQDGSSRVASVRSSAHRPREMAPGPGGRSHSQGHSHGHSQSQSQGYSQGHSHGSRHSHTRQEPPFVAAGNRFHS